MFDGIDIKLYQEELWNFTLNTKVNNMDISCLNTIIFDDLAFNFDIKSSISYNENTANTITSTTFYNQYRTDNIILNDYGLTQYDIGETTHLSASTTLTRSDKLFTLKPIKYNDASGNTLNYGVINSLTSSTIGNHFNLNGGYLNNYFKLDGFNYELLPYRYAEGFTIETWVSLSAQTFITNTGVNDNFFLFLGTRGENKYSIKYSGETGFTTFSGQTLGSDHTSGDTTEYEKGLNNSVIGFKFNNDYTLSVRYINSENNLQEYKSNKVIVNTGWTMFSIVYEPYEIITDKDLLDCKAIRLGDLKIYINGLNYLTVNDFEETWFKALDTQSDKQIGVPYNLSWGGGSFGLKHSYHYNPFWQQIDENLITVGDNGTFSNTTSGITSPYTITIDSATTFSGNTLLITGNFFSSNELVLFNQNFNLEARKRYKLKLDIKENDLFISSGGCLRLAYSGNTTGITELSRIDYDGLSKNTWKSISIDFETSSAVKTGDTIDFRLIVDSPSSSVTGNFILNIDNANLYKSNYIESVFSKDFRKDNLLIEEQFDGNFIGDIQILRFYLKPLKIHEIRHNFNILKKRYKLRQNFGGRKIYI